MLLEDPLHGHELDPAVAQGLEAVQVVAELVPLGGGELVLEFLDVLGHGVEDVAGAGVLLLQAAALHDAAEQLLEGAHRVLLEGQLLALPLGGDRREGRPLAALTILEAHVVEHRGELLGQVAIDGGEQGRGVGRGLVATQRPVEGAVPRQGHLAAQALEDAQPVPERREGAQALRHLTPGEGHVDEGVAAMLEALGVEVVPLQAAALDDKDKAPGQLPPLGHGQVPEEGRERDAAGAERKASQDGSAVEVHGGHLRYKKESEVRRLTRSSLKLPSLST